MRICGRNTSTLPVPAMMPSNSSPRSGPAWSEAPSHWLRNWTPELIAFFGSTAQLKTACNTLASSTGPAKGFSTTASSRDSSASRVGTR